MAKLTTTQLIQSFFAALIGVQSEKNRERDFQQGSLKNFIIMGIVGTLLFILVLVMIVSSVT